MIKFEYESTDWLEDVSDAKLLDMINDLMDICNKLLYDIERVDEELAFNELVYNHKLAKAEMELYIKEFKWRKRQ